MKKPIRGLFSPVWVFSINRYRAGGILSNEVGMCDRDACFKPGCHNFSSHVSQARGMNSTPNTTTEGCLKALPFMLNRKFASKALKLRSLKARFSSRHPIY